MLKIFLIANSQPRECSTWGQTCSCPRTFISSDMKTAYCSSKTFSSNICKLSHTCLSNQVCYLLSYWNSSSRKRWEHISSVQVQRKCVFMYVALFIWSNFLIFDICSLWRCQLILQKFSWEQPKQYCSEILSPHTIILYNFIKRISKEITFIHYNLES